jgi:hypothetical protein
MLSLRTSSSLFLLFGLKKVSKKDCRVDEGEAS